MGRIGCAGSLDPNPSVRVETPTLTLTRMFSVGPTLRPVLTSVRLLAPRHQCYWPASRWMCNYPSTRPALLMSPTPQFAARMRAMTSPLSTRNIQSSARPCAVPGNKRASLKCSWVGLSERRISGPAHVDEGGESRQRRTRHCRSGLRVDASRRAWNGRSSAADHSETGHCKAGAYGRTAPSHSSFRRTSDALCVAGALHRSPSQVMGTKNDLLFHSGAVCRTARRARPDRRRPLAWLGLGGGAARHTRGWSVGARHRS